MNGRSSWKWLSDQEFNSTVHPVHLNDVRHVYNLNVIASAADNIEEMLLDLEELREDNRKLGATVNTKEAEAAYDTAHGLAVSVSHYGECLLLHQRWLAHDPASGRFISAKGAIHHAAHDPHRKATPYDFRKLYVAVDAMLAAYDRQVEARSRFVVDEVHELPATLKRGFQEARDLFSLGFDEMGLFACGRGLEAVVRAVLEERAVEISSKGGARKAAQSNLHDLIECMDRLNWDDGSRFIGRQTSQLLHWIRSVRNESAHPGDSDLDAHRMAPVVAQAAMSLWRDHMDMRNRSLKTNLVTL